MAIQGQFLSQYQMTQDLDLILVARCCLFQSLRFYGEPLDRSALISYYFFQLRKSDLQDCYIGLS
jgi:hypothetical protein